jgi:hypothetical protein
VTIAGANVSGTANVSTLVVTGNQSFVGTGNRITGDFSNATVANRVMFQSSTTNGNTLIGAIPNGTGQNARIQTFASSDPTNTATLSIESNLAISQAAITSGITGTGSYLPMTFFTGGSESLRLSATTKAVILAGGSTSANGTGITFPATQSASSDVNTLDDYEEGTWTPVVADATTGGNTATGSFSGTYTKIGNLVFVSATLNNINTSGMTGGNVLFVRSLPFVSSNGPDAVGSCFLDRITFTGFVAPYVAPNNSVIDFRESISNTSDTALTVSDVNVSGGSDIFLSVTYLAT